MLIICRDLSWMPFQPRRIEEPTRLSVGGSVGADQMYATSRAQAWIIFTIESSEC